MAKIIKVGSQNITPNKIANPFRTSRNSTTNPFKYSNFEGNTLQFADVFEGFEPKKTNKLRMIASSAIGSMNKMKSSITEPIVNFAKRVYAGVKEGIPAAWNYLANTSISDAPGLRRIPGIKQFDEAMSMELHLPSLSGMTGKMSEIHKGLLERSQYLNKDIKEVGRDMMHGASTIGENISLRLKALAEKLPSRTHYTAAMSVADLEVALREE